MPQSPSVIATKTITSDLYIFDYTQHGTEAAADGVCRPQLKLKGHTKEGYVTMFPPSPPSFSESI